MSFACELNNVGLIELLLRHSADPSLTDLEGNNCLHYVLKGPSANSKSKVECLKLILNHTNKINEVNRDHKSALMLAQYIDDPKVTQILIERGAKVSLRDKDGN